MDSSQGERELNETGRKWKYTIFSRFHIEHILGSHFRTTISQIRQWGMPDLSGSISSSTVKRHHFVGGTGIFFSLTIILSQEKEKVFYQNRI